jgi:glycosyltransferase involved in cell wall biosynthesis
MAASPPLRVLEVLGNAIPGGMEHYVGNLLENFGSSIRPTVIAPFVSPMTERWAALGIPVHIAAIDDEIGLAHSVERIVELARHVQADVLHAHLPNAHAASTIAGAACGVPVVATIHGRQLTLRDVEALQLGEGHAVMVCEYGLAQARLLGIDASRVSWIPNGVDTQRFSPSPARIASQSVTVGFVGRLAPEKGPLDFVRVAALLLHATPTLRFRIIGDGPLRGEVESAVVRSSLADRVELVGMVHDMPAAYRGLDMLVSTSQSEGAPLAILEAMACGLPVIATSVGGVPEIVSDGVTGRVCPPRGIHMAADTVEELASRPDKRLDWGRAARKRVLENYDLRTHVAKITALFERIAGRSAATRELEDRAATRPHGGEASAAAPLSLRRVTDAGG